MSKKYNRRDLSYRRRDGNETVAGVRGDGVHATRGLLDMHNSVLLWSRRARRSRTAETAGRYFRRALETLHDCARPYVQNSASASGRRVNRVTRSRRRRRLRARFVPKLALWVFCFHVSFRFFLFFLRSNLFVPSPPIHPGGGELDDPPNRDEWKIASALVFSVSLARTRSVSLSLTYVSPVPCPLPPPTRWSQQPRARSRTKSATGRTSRTRGNHPYTTYSVFIPSPSPPVRPPRRYRISSFGGGESSRVRRHRPQRSLIVLKYVYVRTCKRDPRTAVRRICFVHHFVATVYRLNTHLCSFGQALRAPTRPEVVLIFSRNNIYAENNCHSPRTR